MSERFWFLSIGPLDEISVVEWVAGLNCPPDGSPEVELIDNRQWYARAMDADTVRDALVALKQGISGAAISDDIRLSVAGVVSDMEVWLEQEFDARRE